MSKSISFGDFVLLLCSIILIVNLFTAYLVYFFLKEVGERIKELDAEFVYIKHIFNNFKF